MNTFEIGNQLRKNIFSLLDILKLDSQELSDLLEVQQKDLSGPQLEKVLDLDKIVSLCDKLNITFDHLVSGHVDYTALTQQFRGQTSSIPEKYADPNSHLARGRTVLGIYNYLKRIHGHKYANGTLQKLQVFPHIISDPDQYISSHLVLDLLNELNRSHFSERAIIEIGRNAIHINNQTKVGKLLSNSKTPQDLYERVHGEVIGSHYDKLFNYTLRSSRSNRIEMVTNINSDAQDLLKTKLIGNRQMCLYKQGVYTSFLGHIDLRHFKLLESECLYLGGKQCVFHVSW